MTNNESLARISIGEVTETAELLLQKQANLTVLRDALTAQAKKIDAVLSILGETAEGLMKVDLGIKVLQTGVFKIGDYL